MYLEQTQLSQATGTHTDTLFFRTPRALLCKVLNNQSPTRHSFSKPANSQKGPGKLQMQIPGPPSRTHGREPQKRRLEQVPQARISSRLGDAHPEEQAEGNQLRRGLLCLQNAHHSALCIRALLLGSSHSTQTKQGTNSRALGRPAGKPADAEAAPSNCPAHRSGPPSLFSLILNQTGKPAPLFT